MRRRSFAPVAAGFLSMTLLGGSNLVIMPPASATPGAVPTVASAALLLRTPTLLGGQPEVAYQDMPNGIDVASWQHPNGADVDFQRVRESGYAYVFVKATESTHYVNDYYVNDAMAAQGNGVLMGGYHYADVRKSAAEQARIFSETISVRGGTSLPPVLDLEEAHGQNSSQLATWTREFLAVTEQLTGRQPIVYSYRSFWINQMGNTPQFNNYPLWIADYNGQQGPTLPLPGGWTSWVFWQYSSQANIDGVQEQNVDANKFGGTEQQLRVFAATGTIPEKQSTQASPATPTASAEPDSAEPAEPTGSNPPQVKTL